MRSLAMSMGIVSLLYALCLGSTARGGRVMGQNEPRGQIKSDERAQLMKEMSTTIYRVQNHDVTTTVKSNALQPDQAKHLELIRRVFSEIRNKVSVPDGAKVVLRSVDPKTAVIIFGEDLGNIRLGQKRGDYIAKVNVNLETGKVLKIEVVD